MSIEEQIRRIAIEELDAKSDEIDKKLRSTIKRESSKLKEELEALSGKIDELGTSLADVEGRITTLEEELNNRWSLVVKLRKYTLDQLMSEYKRLTGAMRPEQEETDENAEI